MSKYDYLVVGSGLFGAIFAHEAAKKGKMIKVIEKENMLLATFIPKKWRGFRSTNMVPTFFTLLTRRFGIISINLLSLIAIPIPQLPTIRVRFTIFPLT